MTQQYWILRGLTVAGLVLGITSTVACGSGGNPSVSPGPTTTMVEAAKVSELRTNTPSTTALAATTTVQSASPSNDQMKPSVEPGTTPAPPTSLAGGPIPEAPGWFCAELAFESAELVLEVEAVLPEDGGIDARSQHALLLATRNLLAWTNNRVPDELRPDVGLLNRVYADLGVELDRLDAETVTMPRLQALVFAYVVDSPVVDGVELDLSARRLAAYVDQSCGHGYPIMEAMTDLFDPTPEEQYLSGES